MKRRTAGRRTTKIAGIILGVGVLLGLKGITANGMESQSDDLTENVGSSFFEETDLTEMDEMLETLFPEETDRFADLVNGVISGEMPGREWILRVLKKGIFGAAAANRKAILQLILLALVSAVFLRFAEVFQTRQVSEISFYMIYFLMIGICIRSFQSASVWVTEGLGKLTGFVKVLYPIFFAAVTVAKGSASSGAFYHLAVILIVVVEEVLLHLMIPMIHMYVMIRILNSLQKEDYLYRFAELMETVIGWSLKTLMGCMIGLNVVQGMLGPAVDAIRRKALTKGVEAIPGIGDALGGTAEVLMGTAALIKNGIGIAGAVICVGICLAPLIQLAVITLGYQFAAAVVQPVSDARIAECLSGVGDGCRMLLKCVFVSGMLFLLTIAIAVYTTGMT